MRARASTSRGRPWSRPSRAGDRGRRVHRRCQGAASEGFRLDLAGL